MRLSAGASSLHSFEWDGTSDCDPPAAPDVQRALEPEDDGSLLEPTRMVRDGALLSVVASTYVLLLLRFNPRIFLRHYPKEIQENVPPKTAKEKRMSIGLGIPLILLLVGSPFASSLIWRAEAQTGPSFWELAEHAFGVIFIFNLFDLLILDWLILCRFTPRWVLLPGAEHIVIPKPYLQHFQGFLAGTIFSVVVGIAAAAFLKFLL